MTGAFSVQQSLAGGAVGQHVVSLSGGKDSSAMLLRMLEVGMKVDRVLFFDTGMEFEGVLQQVRKFQNILPQYGIKLEWYKPASTWDTWFYGRLTRGKREGNVRGWPLLLFGCWWRREAKEKLAREHIRPFDTVYIGFAADEAHRVKEYKYGQARQRYPLMEWGWKERDALAYIIKRDFFEPVHRQFNRTGCYTCPMQPKASLRTLRREYPQLWARMLEYERRSPDTKFNPKFTLKEFDTAEKKLDLPTWRPA